MDDVVSRVISSFGALVSLCGATIAGAIAVALQALLWALITSMLVVRPLFSMVLIPVGSLMLLLFLAIFAYVGLRVALACRSNQHKLVAIGATSLLVGQSILNIAVASGSMPTTGLPLPMISYGGNSLLGALLTAGLLVRCSIEATGLETVRPRRRRTPPAPIG
jgi:cell division protein FtsW